MKRHDLSGLFGDMPKDDFAKLTEDIKRHGLQHPIVTWQGKILDGWHRYNACKSAGIEPKFVEFSGNSIEQKAPALLPAVERGDIGLLTAERVANTYAPEVIAKATPAEIKGFAKTLSERPEARCKSLVRAAQELRDQWLVLSRMQPTDEIIAAFAEVRFVLRGFEGGR